jgi:hypothetical protein
VPDHRGWQHQDGASPFQIETMSRNHIYEPKEIGLNKDVALCSQALIIPEHPHYAGRAWPASFCFAFFRFVFRFFRRPLPELHCGQGQLGT